MAYKVMMDHHLIEKRVRAALYRISQQSVARA